MGRMSLEYSSYDVSPGSVPRLVSSAMFLLLALLRSVVFQSILEYLSCEWMAISFSARTHHNVARLALDYPAVKYALPRKLVRRNCVEVVGIA